MHFNFHTLNFHIAYFFYKAETRLEFDFSIKILRREENKMFKVFPYRKLIFFLPRFFLHHRDVLSVGTAGNPLLNVFAILVFLTNND